jgi:dolichol-phosphate mannosyltransferase
VNAPPTRPLVAIVVPAYNEEQNLPRLFGELESLSPGWPFDVRVVVADDGSTDATAALVRDHAGPLRVELVQEGRNQGPAGALVSGIKHAVADEAVDYVVTIEADTTSDLGVLPALIAGLQAGADVVQGSVRTGEGRMVGVSRLRTFTSWGANALLRAVSGVRLATITNMYRAIRADTLRSSLARRGGRLVADPGFAGVSELLLALHRDGARLTEVPVVLDAAKRSDHSNIRLVRTALAYFQLAGRTLAGRIR